MPQGWRFANLKIGQEKQSSEKTNSSVRKANVLPKPSQNQQGLIFSPLLLQPPQLSSSLIFFPAQYPISSVPFTSAAQPYSNIPMNTQFRHLQAIKSGKDIKKRKPYTCKICNR